MASPEKKVGTAELRRLIRLVDASDEGGREIDAEIAYDFIPAFADAGRRYYSGSAFGWKTDGPKMRAQIIKDHFSEHGQESYYRPDYTTSLEAAVDFCADLHPGIPFVLLCYPNGTWGAGVAGSAKGTPQVSRREYQNGALALIAASLRAALSAWRVDVARDERMMGDAA